jgi:hypothetical protein
VFIRLIPRSIAKQNNNRVCFCNSSKSSVLLFALFMDSLNSIGYKLGSTSDTVIPVYYARQAGDLLVMLHTSTRFAQFFFGTFSVGLQELNLNLRFLCVYVNCFHDLVRCMRKFCPNL